MKKFNECELGNPSFPSDMTGIGSPDKWDNVLSIQKQNNKYKNKKIKMRNRSDKATLDNLVEKYGKTEILKKIDEAFSSSKLQNYDAAIRKNNRDVEAKAQNDRREKMDRLYKQHYDRKNFEGPRVGYYDYVEDDAERNRRYYEWNAKDVQDNFKKFITKNKLESLNSLLKKYGLHTIDWSNVQDDDFGETTKERARKFARNNYYGVYILFWEDSDGRIFAITSGTNVLHVRYPLRVKGKWNTDDTKVKDLIEDPNVETVYVLNVGDHYKNWSNKRLERNTAKSGMQNRTASENDNIRNENINRYKRIIAQNNISKFDIIDKTVRKAVKDAATYYSLDDANLNVVFKIGKKVEAMLSQYSEFCRVRSQVKSADSTNDSRWYGNVDFYNNKLKGMEKLIDDIVNDIYELLP